MGITIPRKRLELVLEQAVNRAEGGEPLAETWAERIMRISDCPSRSYVAAFGTALLAKAADERVDALTVKYSAGPTAYSMRGVVKVLVEKAPLYRYHLGRTGPEPLNNQPWFHSDRVDRPVRIEKKARPYHRDLVRYLVELNQGSAAEAMDGLVAFVRLRQAAASDEAEELSRLQVESRSRIGDLIDILELFVREDAENGRRGQALAAALLDLVHDDVRLSSIHDPSGLDVTVWHDKQAVLAVEVKQKPVNESSVLHVADEAKKRAIDKAVFFALAPQQRRLDREMVRLAALDDQGVIISIFEGVAEAVVAHAVASRSSVADFAARLPSTYLRRMREHNVSVEGQRYWSDLCGSLVEVDALKPQLE